MTMNPNNREWCEAHCTYYQELAALYARIAADLKSHQWPAAAKQAQQMSSGYYAKARQHLELAEKCWRYD